MGLDKASNTAKSWGGKAIGVVKQATGALKKRFQPVLDVVGKGAELLSKAAPAILSAPAFLACKVLGCATPKLVDKGSQRSKEATDFATDVIPGVSTVKDTCKCLTGDNIVTGKDEGVGGRIMACIWAAVDVASIIVGIFTAGTGTVAIQAIKTAAKAGLKGLVKAGLKGFKAMVKAAIDLVKKAWKKITSKGPGKLPDRTPTRKPNGLGETASKPGDKLTRRELDLELDAVDRGRRRPSTVPGYVDEVELPNGHTWRRDPAGSLCRFSKKPDVCVTPGDKKPDYTGRRQAPERDPSTTSRLSRPQGMSPLQWQRFKRAVRRLARAANLPPGELAVHGSRASGTARPSSDFDIILRVDADIFFDFATARIASVRPNTRLHRTLLRAARAGKLSRFDIAPSFNKLLRNTLPSRFDVDFSIIRVGSKFDNGPFIPIGRF